MIQTTTDRLYLKKEKMFIPWEGNVLVYKINRKKEKRLDLNKFEKLRPLLTHIKEYLSIKCNSTHRNIESIYYNIRFLNDFVEMTGRTINSFTDIDIELITSYVSVLRDNPKILKYSVWNASAIFSTFKGLYNFCYKRHVSGTVSEANFFISRCKLPHKETGIAIKTMDVKKGPYVKIELAVLDKFFGELINKWDELNSQQMSACILYLLNRESSRRFGELVELEVTDLLRSEDGSFVKLWARKRARGGDLHKARHKISDWVYDYAMRYIEETRAIREELNTAKLFVWRSNANLHSEDWQSYVVTGNQATDYCEFLIRKATLPNRLFFSQTVLTVSDLNNDQNKHFRLNFTSSRIRDTFGSMNAALNMPLELVAVRMGHTTVSSTKKYYIVLRPEMIAELLSKKLGAFYGKLASYFHNPVTNEITTTKIIFDPEDPSSLGFGGCLGNYCNHHPRIACYNCSRFQPLKTSEHRKSLEWLMHKKEQLIAVVNEAGGKTDEAHLKLTLENINNAIACCESIISQCNDNVG